MVLTKDPGAYAGGCRVTRASSRRATGAVLRELAATPGVTVLIYDELCANERRRRQKRGKLPAPTASW